MSLSGIRRYCHTTVILKRKGLLSVLSDDIINLVKYRITSAEEKMISANLLLEAGQLDVYKRQLMGTGGNCGSQSSTLVIRGLAVGEIQFKDIFRVIFKEIRVALVVSVLLAVVNGIRIYIMYGQNITLAIALGITMMAVVVMAKCIGCTLPLLAKKLGLDPAIMAAPLITTILDTCTILVYFNIVTAIFHLNA